MSTLTATKSGTINFLNTFEFINKGKRPDWRYENWQSLSPYRSKRDGDREKKVYWVGIVDLKHVEKDKKSYPLLVAYSNRITADTYTGRHEDGAASDFSPTIFYNLSCVLGEMLKAKRYKYRFYHLFLEEEVDYHGEHKVSVLKNTDPTPRIPIGLKSYKPWPEEKVSKWVGYANWKMSDDYEFERICILANGSYNWMK